MRRFLLFFVTSLSFSKLYSQEPFSIGFRGGINVPGLSINSANPVVNGFTTKLSPFFGLILEEGINSKWSLLQEVNIANATITKSGPQVIPTSAYDNLKIIDVSKDPHLYGTFDSKFQTRYLEFPVMLKYYVYQDENINFFVNGGLFGGILLFGNVGTNGTGKVYTDAAHKIPLQPAITISFTQNQNLIDWLKPVNFGLQTGIGFSYKGDFGDFIVNVSSNFGVVNIEENAGDGASKTKSLVVSAGYLFHLSK